MYGLTLKPVPRSLEGERWGSEISSLFAFTLEPPPCFPVGFSAEIWRVIGRELSDQNAPSISLN